MATITVKVKIREIAPRPGEERFVYVSEALTSDQITLAMDDNVMGVRVDARELERAIRAVREVQR